MNTLQKTKLILFILFILGNSLLFAKDVISTTDTQTCLFSAITSLVKSIIVRGKRPNPYWENSSQIIKENDNYYVIFDSRYEIKKVKVEKWTKKGNPVIKINSRSKLVKFEPTQGSLDNFDKYKDDHTTKLEKITKKNPIQVYYYPSKYSAQFSINNGHHRYFFARRHDEDIYIEILRTKDEAYNSGTSWDALPYGH